jgi:hypothetical protein
MLNQVERLRSQLEAMTASRHGNGPQQSQNDQSSGHDLGKQQSGNGGQPLGQTQQGSAQRDGAGQLARNRPGQPGTGQPGTDQPGIDQRGDISGDVRYGGGGADADVLGNINTGNNRYGHARQQPVPTDASGNPPDNEHFYQQGMQELNQLRQMVQSDPQAAKEVRELASQMQKLDPSRFPGNPEMVERMHNEVLSSLDRIELQLQHDASTEARTGKPSLIPEGYQDSVAEYYKRLSRNP